MCASVCACVLCVCAAGCPSRTNGINEIYYDECVYRRRERGCIPEVEFSIALFMINCCYAHIQFVCDRTEAGQLDPYRRIVLWRNEQKIAATIHSIHRHHLLDAK